MVYKLSDAAMFLMVTGLKLLRNQYKTKNAVLAYVLCLVDRKRRILFSLSLLLQGG